MHFSTIETGVKFRIGPIEMEILWPLVKIRRDLRSGKIYNLKFHIIFDISKRFPVLILWEHYSKVVDW